MTRPARFWAGALLSSMLTASVIASGSVTGVWHGKFKYDYTKLPAGLGPDQRAGIEAEGKRHANDLLTLTLKPDHTFSLAASSALKVQPPLKGRWGQASDSISIQPVRNGKPGSPQKFELSKDGKHLAYTYGPTTMLFWR